MACGSGSCCKSQQQQQQQQQSNSKTYGAVDQNTPAETQPLLRASGADAGDIEADAGSSRGAACVRSDPLVTGQCCRTLKGKEEQRTLIDPDTIRDFIIGLSDGLTVPFALTAGLSSVGSSRLVVIAGVAELTSGAISMGIGGYLSAQAEIDHYVHSQTNTAGRVAQSCDEQLQSEVLDILAPYGIVGGVADQVAQQLQKAEQDKQGKQRALQRQAEQEGQLHQRGLTPFLVRLGQGLEPISSERSTRSAFNIGAAYFIGGLVPLLPYFVFATAFEGLVASTVLTSITLLLFGVAKHRVTGGEESVRSYAWSAFSTLVVGGAAAASSWLIVKVLEGRGGDGLNDI